MIDREWSVLMGSEAEVGMLDMDLVAASVHSGTIDLEWRLPSMVARVRLCTIGREKNCWARLEATPSLLAFG